jgi:hypothetical protein
MGEGLIVRRGGASKQTATPSILDFSTASATSIKFKLRNNDSVAATLVYRFGTVTGDGESISVAANTTTDEITLTVPEITAPTKLFVTANATGKVKSEVAEQEFETFVVYTAATGGTTAEYDDGGKRYKSHTFTSDGTFTVTTVGNGDRNAVDYLIIAGGGGGGGDRGGGGGAGGYLTTLGATSGDVTPNAKFTVTTTSYSVDVGSGGAGSATSSSSGSTGDNSSVFSITSTGGGGGGTGGGGGNNGTVGLNGGSGGGGVGTSSAGDRAGGTGISGQGFAGGIGLNGQLGGAGGGGASVVGANGASNNGGNGGNGLANTLRDGTSETRAGGGGGARHTGGTNGTGGTGGGGNAEDGTGSNGTANTGGGAGGGSNQTSPFLGGSGGSGIVVIRYEIAPSV